MCCDTTDGGSGGGDGGVTSGVAYCFESNNSVHLYLQLVVVAKVVLIVV